jgi:mannose-6-phosphate isomerase-like protein (cupin superfamily)
MIENIKYKNKNFGFIITYNKKKGVNFLTPNNLSHQIGFIKHSKNHIIKPHWHHKNSRIINYTSEVLIILKGKIRVDFYTKKEKYLFSKIISKNDIVILIDGGHGFKILKPTEIIEVKQGPYSKNKDKKIFKPIDDSKVKLK